MPYRPKGICLAGSRSRANLENRSRKLISNVLDLFTRDQRWNSAITRVRYGLMNRVGGVLTGEIISRLEPLIVWWRRARWHQEIEEAYDYEGTLYVGSRKLFEHIRNSCIMEWHLCSHREETHQTSR